MSITITDTMVAFLIVGLAPGILFLWFFLHQARMDKSHRKLMIRTFLLGSLAIIPVYIINKIIDFLFNFDIAYFLNTNAISQSLFYIFLGCLIMAGIEEYSKSLIVREVDWNKKTFSRIIDGIEFSVACGLGFAFIENAIYFWNIYHMVYEVNIDLLWSIIFRSSLSMMAHAVFSGIFGYYYGKAKVMNIRYKKNHPKPHILHFNPFKAFKIRLLRLSHLLSFKNLHSSKVAEFIHEKELVAEGLLIAILLHTFYNFFLSIQLAWVSVIIIAVEFLVILHEFEIHQRK